MEKLREFRFGGVCDRTIRRDLQKRYAADFRIEETTRRADRLRPIRTGCAQSIGSSAKSRGGCLLVNVQRAITRVRAHKPVPIGPRSAPPPSDADQLNEKASCGRSQVNFRWRRRELQLRPKCRKPFSNMIVASSSHTSGCIMSARRRQGTTGAARRNRGPGRDGGTIDENRPSLKPVRDLILQGINSLRSRGRFRRQIQRSTPSSRETQPGWVRPKSKSSW